MSTHHKVLEDSGLAEGLKQARESKGLSQRELGARIAVPQSHISKIESGVVDLKASSLIEFARALDLEVMLVPRSLVPAVEALSRPSQQREAQQPDEAKSVLRVRRALANLQKNARRIIRKLGQLPEITRLLDAAQALDQVTLTPEDADQALEAIKDINLRSEDPALQAASQAADKLRNIRNALAHGASESPARALPAYRLSDGDDDA